MKHDEFKRLFECEFEFERREFLFDAVREWSGNSVHIDLSQRDEFWMDTKRELRESGFSDDEIHMAKEVIEMGVDCG